MKLNVLKVLSIGNANVDGDETIINPPENVAFCEMYINMSHDEIASAETSAVFVRRKRLNTYGEEDIVGSYIATLQDGIIANTVFNTNKFVFDINSSEQIRVTVQRAFSIYFNVQFVFYGVS